MRRLLIGLAGLLIAMQAVPYGRSHINPPVTGEPAWDSPRTRALAVRTCFDCHSNETTWPWYSNIPPVSWLIQRDVDEGRKKVNYSEWHRPQNEARESAESVQKGEMPQWYYVMLHPQAKLSSAERQALIRGLATTFGRGEQGEHEK